MSNPRTAESVASGISARRWLFPSPRPTGAERERLYSAQAALMPGFAEYQRKTTRQIPVVVLEPIN